MELSQLTAFYRVAITGSFSKAAEDLFVSQPALSRQIAALEKDLGLQLFSRLGKKITLTDAGRRLFVYAEKMIDLYNEAKKEMVEFKDLAIGELMLGASTTIGNYLLPSVLAVFQERYSGIKVNLHVNNSSQVEQLVSENKIDLGLLAGFSQVQGLYQEQIAEDELFFVVPPTHRLAEATAISPMQLSQETLLCREAGSDTQFSFNKLLENLGIVPQKTMVLGDTEAIKRGVISGMGVALLSKYTFKYELRLKLLVPLKFPELVVRRPLTCVYIKNARLSPAALAFLALLKKEFIGQNALLFPASSV